MFLCVSEFDPLGFIPFEFSSNKLSFFHFRKWHSYCFFSAHKTPESVIKQNANISSWNGKHWQLCVGKAEDDEDSTFKLLYINVHCKHEVLTASKRQDKLNAVILCQP